MRKRFVNGNSEVRNLTGQVLDLFSRDHQFEFYKLQSH